MKDFLANTILWISFLAFAFAAIFLFVVTFPFIWAFNRIDSKAEYYEFRF